ncbi:MAG: phage tail tape measure protein [Treponema sp.]|nr:phage tail tape measure protein [Treponema sp.]
MAKKVELNYQVNIHEGVNNLEKSVQQIDQSLKNLKFSNNFSKDAKSQVDDLTQRIKKYKELLEKPVKTESDFSKIKQEGNEIIRLYEKLNTQSKKIGNQSAKSIFSNKYGESFNKATAALKQFDSQIAKHNKELKEQQQLQEQSTKELEKFKNKYGTGSTQEEQKKYLSYQKGAITRKENAIKRGMEEGTITKKAGNEQLNALKNQKASLSGADAAKEYQRLNQVVIQTTQSLERLKKGQINIASDKALTSALNEITTAMQQLGLNVPKIETFSDLEKLKETISSFPVEKQREIEQQLKTFAQSAETASGGSARLKEQLALAQQEIDNMAARAKNLDMLRSRLEYIFGITGMINIFRRAIRSTYNTIKELDEVMTETAVVTNYTVGDMWNKIDEYADVASKLGVSIKGVYEVTTLLYQMGMNTSQAMGAGTEILKMARIAGLDYASAVDAMISALKGFNMEVNAINTKKINDIYSRIAAISASNVEELSTAMSKTASIAANAGMEVESTTALLAQGIEKTREPAETIGTALKTVIA